MSMLSLILLLLSLPLSELISLSRSCSHGWISTKRKMALKAFYIFAFFHYTQQQVCVMYNVHAFIDSQISILMSIVNFLYFYVQPSPKCRKVRLSTNDEDLTIFLEGNSTWSAPASASASIWRGVQKFANTGRLIYLWNGWMEQLCSRLS